MPELNQSVTNPQNPSAPVAEATPGAAGVAFTATPGQGVGDAPVVDYKVELEKLQTQLKQTQLDLRRQQASLQSTAAKTEQQLQNEVNSYKARLDDIAKTKMNDTERLAYERDQVGLENARLKQALQEQQNALAQAQQVQTYVSAFTELGIPADQLDTSSAEALANSGWQAMATLIKELRAGKPVTQQAVASNPQQPHQPYTGQSTVASTGKTTFADVKAAVVAKLGPMSDDQVWNLMEQGRVAAPETL